MNKKIIKVLAVMSAAVILAGCGDSKAKTEENTKGKLNVYTSFYAMEDFAKKIGGDKISVTNLVPAGTEPHDWEPSSSDITNLEKADVLVYNGAGMEHWVTKVTDSLENKKLVKVKASEGVTLKESDEKEESSDNDEDSKYDPHVWMNPDNAKKEMDNIKDALIKADNKNKKYYEDNYEKYSREIDKLNEEYKEQLSKTKSKDIIVAHQAFGYLCDRFGLKQLPIEGLSADSEPDPAKMKEIIDFAKKNKVKVIFFEELVSPKVAESIAKETGAETNMLNPLEGLSDKEQKEGKEYFSVMRDNLKSLTAALN